MWLNTAKDLAMKPTNELRTMRSSDGNDVEEMVRRHPIFRVANELVIRLGWTALLLYAVIVVIFVIRHAPQILGAETRALQLLKAAFEIRP